MKPVIRSLIALIIVTTCSSWGFFAHRRINHVAVFTLPTAMVGFYQTNIDFITEHAIDPDKRRYVDSMEAPRHYLNADHYDKRQSKNILQIRLTSMVLFPGKFNINTTGW